MQGEQVPREYKLFPLDEREKGGSGKWGGRKGERERGREKEKKEEEEEGTREGQRREAL